MATTPKTVLGDTGALEHGAHWLGAFIINPKRVRDWVIPDLTGFNVPVLELAMSIDDPLYS